MHRARGYTLGLYRRTPRGLNPLRCAALWCGLLALFAPGRAGADENSAASTDTAPDLGQIEKAFEEVVERVSPSVVGIRVQRRYMTALWQEPGATVNGAFEQLVTVNGSGTVVDGDGLILTNEHVIQSASEVEVLFYDGQSLPARLIAADARGDLAVLKVERMGLRPVRIVDWPTVKRGQWTISLGNPYGLGGDGKLSVSVGVISNLERRLPGLGEVDDRFYADMIQTTADIHAGCSGGPLFNVRGELIGVVTAMHTRAAADEGVGFAIPMTASRRRIVEDLCMGKRITYGFVGLEVRGVDPLERSAAGLDPRVGAVVENVEPHGPADDAGLRKGDLILRFGGQEVNGPAGFAQLVGQTAPRSTVPMELLRDGQRLVLPVTVQRRDVSRVGWMRGGAILWRGMRLTDLTASARHRLGIEGDSLGVVVIDVLENSAAQRASVQIGDVIEGVADAAVHDLAGLQAHLHGVKGPVRIRICSRGELIVQP